MVMKLIKWILRGWPVLIMVLILSLHLYLINCFNINVKSLNKIVSLIAQIIGGVLVIYSIDSNIGIIKGKNLKEELITYLKEFPLFKKSVVISEQVTISSKSFANIKANVVRNPKTIDEKIDYLQEQIEKIKKELNQNVDELRKAINNLSKYFNEKFHKTNVTLNEIEKKVEEVSVGGIKIQVFGVFLLIYGAISGYFT